MLSRGTNVKRRCSFKNYADLLLQIGSGRYLHNESLVQELSYDDATRTSRLRLPHITHFIHKQQPDGRTTDVEDKLNAETEDSIISWLYPNGFEPSQMSNVG